MKRPVQKWLFYSYRNISTAVRPELLMHSRMGEQPKLLRRLVERRPFDRYYRDQIAFDKGDWPRHYQSLPVCRENHCQRGRDV